MKRRIGAILATLLALAGCFQLQDTDEYLRPCESRQGAVVCEVGTSAHEIALRPEDEFNLPRLEGLSLAYDSGQFPSGRLLNIGEALPDGGANPPASNGTTYVNIRCPSIHIRPDVALAQEVPVRLTLSTQSCEGAAQYELQAADCQSLALFRWDAASSQWQATSNPARDGEGDGCAATVLSGDTLLGTAAAGDYFKIFIAQPGDYDADDSLQLTVDTPLACVNPDTLQPAACDSGDLVLLSFANDLTGRISGGSFSEYPLDAPPFIVEYLDDDGETVTAEQNITRDADGTWLFPRSARVLTAEEFQYFRIRLRNVWGGERTWPPDGPARVYYQPPPLLARELGSGTPALRIRTLADFADTQRLDTTTATWTYFLAGPVRPQRAIMDFAFGPNFPFLEPARFLFHEEDAPATGCSFGPSGVSDCNLDPGLFTSPPQFSALTGRLESQVSLDTSKDTPEDGSGLRPTRYSYQFELTDSFGKGSYPTEPSTLLVRTPVISIDDQQVTTSVGGTHNIPLYFYYDPDVFISGDDRFNGDIKFQIGGWIQGVFCPAPAYFLAGGVDEVKLVGLTTGSSCLSDYELVIQFPVGTAGLENELSPLYFGAFRMRIIVAQPNTTQLRLSVPVQPEGLVPPITTTAGILTNDVRDREAPVVSPPYGVCGISSPDFTADCISVTSPDPRVCFSVQDPVPSSGIRSIEFQRQVGEGEPGEDGTDPILNTDPSASQLVFGNCETNEPLSQGACVAMALDATREGETQRFYPLVDDFSGNPSRPPADPWVSFCYNPPQAVTIPVSLDDVATVAACPDTSRYCTGTGPCTVDTDQVCRCARAIPDSSGDTPYLFEFQLYREDDSTPFLEKREAPVGDMACLDTEGLVNPLDTGAYRMEIRAVANGPVGVISTPVSWHFTVPEFDLPDPVLYGPPPVFPLDISDQFHVCRLTGKVAGVCPFDLGQVAFDLRIQSDLGPDDPVNPVAGYRTRWAGPKPTPDFLESDFRTLPGEGTEHQLLIVRSPEGAYGHFRVEVEGYLRGLTRRDGLPKAVLNFQIAPPDSAISSDLVRPQARIIRMPAGPVTLSPNNRVVTFYIGYDGGMPLNEVAYRYRLLGPQSFSASWSPSVSLQDFNYITTKATDLCVPGIYLFQVKAYNTSVPGLTEEERSDLSIPGAALEIQIPEGASLCGN